MAEHNHRGPGVLRGDNGPVLTPHPGCLACAENMAAAHWIAVQFDVPSVMLGLPDDGRRPDPGPFED